ncbi:MAG: dienelactone hydrolase family protein [Anaerolineales bacterium]|nr:dienelactone hydrolase family protein [Anaerolineales bacterium]
MTKYTTFQEAYNAAIALYQNGEFGPALDLLTEIGPQFPADRLEADYLRSCLAVRVDNVPLTYEILDAFYADGIWLAEGIFRASPSFAPLQGLPEFEQRVAAHAELRAQSDPGDPRKLYTLTPDGDGAAPVILHLHGNGSHPDIELPQWQSAADQGWLVAALASEEVFWAGGRAVWSDHESGEKQLAYHFANLKNDYAIDPSRIILTGFSMGADIALAQTLKGDIVPAQGFLIVAPGGPMIDEPESFQPLIEAAKNRNVRGVIMVSRKDGTIDPDKAAHLAQMLNDGGVPCQFIEYPDEGHFYPADFAKRMGEALAFILES